MSSSRCLSGDIPDNASGKRLSQERLLGQKCNLVHFLISSQCSCSWVLLSLSPVITIYIYGRRRRLHDYQGNTFPALLKFLVSGLETQNRMLHTMASNFLSMKLSNTNLIIDSSFRESVVHRASLHPCCRCLSILQRYFKQTGPQSLICPKVKN